MNDEMILSAEDKQYLLQLWNTLDEATKDALDSFEDFIQEAWLTWKWHL